MKDEDGDEKSTFREQARRAALVWHEDTVGRAVGIHQQGRRAELSAVVAQGQKGVRVDLNKIRLITGEGLPNITKD